MKFVEDKSELVREMPRVVRGDTHWVFVTDDREVHVALSDLLMSLTLGRLATGRDDVPDVVAACFDVATVQNPADRFTVSFLAVPKADLEPDVLRAFARHIGSSNMEAGVKTGKPFFVILRDCEGDDERYETVVSMLANATDGRLGAANAPVGVN